MDDMNRTSEKPNSETLALVKTGSPEVSKPAKKAPGRRGRKPSTLALSATPRRRRRKLPPGSGAKSLLNSVNSLVYDESDRIVRALVDQTIAGKTASARLLVELSGAKRPPSENDDKDDGPGLAELLMSSG